MEMLAVLVRPGPTGCGSDDPEHQDHKHDDDEQADDAVAGSGDGKYCWEGHVGLLT